MAESSNEKILELLNAPQGQRRLDTLARLLESNMTCTAVCLLNKTLHIATNDIYANFDGQIKPEAKELTTRGFAFLKKATTRFLSSEFQQKDVYTKADRDIILTNFKGKSVTYYKGQQDTPTLKDEEIDGMINYLLEAKSTQDFMSSKSLEFFKDFVIPDKSDVKSETPKKSQLFGKILDVQRTFHRLWRDVRDYRKFKEMVLKGNLAFDACKILCVGQKEEHAEMRLLGYLLNKPGVFAVQEDKSLSINEPLYLGISKLCCPYCVETLNVFNKQLVSAEKEAQLLRLQVGDDSEVDDDALHSSSSLLSASEQALEKEVLKSDVLLGSRGSHPLRFQWVLPAFARHPEINGDWLCVALKKWSDQPAKPKEQTVYVVKKGTHEVYRCKLFLPASSITHTGKGASRRFKISPSLIEIGVAKKHLVEKEGVDHVRSQHLRSEEELYYCSGYRSQEISLSLGEDGKAINIECSLLEASGVGVQLRECLEACKFGTQLLAAYQMVSERVVDLKGEVRMVASTSSSSVGVVDDNLEEVEFVLGSDVKSHHFIELDEEFEHAEEESSRESDRRGSSDATVDSDDDGSEYKP